MRAAAVTAVHNILPQEGSKGPRSPTGGLSLSLLFGEKAFRFAGGVRGGGSPLVLDRMPAKSLRQQAFAPRSGRLHISLCSLPRPVPLGRGCFLGCEADKKARHYSGCRKSPTGFFGSLGPPVTDRGPSLVTALTGCICPWPCSGPGASRPGLCRPPRPNFPGATPAGCRRR